MISHLGLPALQRSTICLLNSSVKCLGCLGSLIYGPPVSCAPPGTVHISVANPDLVAQLLDADGVEAVGGLVEHEQAWPGDQRQRESQALPHAHREAPGALLPGVREAHGGEHLIYAALGKAQQRGAHAQVLARGEVGVERRLLDEAADGVEVLPAPGVPGEDDLAGRRPQHPADHLECGRLARAVGAEQAVYLSLADVEAHVRHGLLRLVAAAEALSEPARLEHVAHGFVPSLPGARAESPCPRALPFGFTIHGGARF